MRSAITTSFLLLALAGLARPVEAQSPAEACVNEIRRLSEAFGIDEAAGEARVAVEQAPGARKGATLGAEQRREIGRLARDAREAGERGDEAGCVQRLAGARSLLREAGLGAGQAGTADSGPGVAGSAGITGNGGAAGGGGLTRPAGSAATTAPGAGAGGGGAGSAPGLNTSAERARSGGGALGGTAGGSMGGGGGSSGGGGGGGGP